MSTRPILLAWLLLLAAGASATDERRASAPGQAPSSRMTSPRVDGTFVRLAIKFLRSGNEELLSKIAETPAARHLAAHARRIAPTDPAPTAIDIVRQIVPKLSRSASDLDGLEARLRWFETDRATQRRFWEEASSLLPERALSGTVLYLAHPPRFAADQEAT